MKLQIPLRTLILLDYLGIIIIAMICLFLSQSTFAQCEGNIELSSQAAVDAFMTDYGCSTVDGDLTVSGSDILDLSNLSALTTINGSLILENNGSLTSLVGLENLASIDESLLIIDNDALTGLVGLEGLTSVDGDIRITENLYLQDLIGLEGLTSIGGDLYLEKNVNLKNLEGLDNLIVVGANLILIKNYDLTNISALENLISVGEDLVIDGNNDLTSLDGLENLTSISSNLSIDDNDALTSLNALENLVYVSSNLSIESNDALTNLYGLGNLTSIDGNLRVSYNDNLTSLTSLGNLTSLNGSLIIVLNEVLTSLAGLEGLTSVGKNLRITANYELVNLLGLENITSVGGDLEIMDGDDLINLVGLDNLTFVKGDISILENNDLINLVGLENVTSEDGGLFIVFNDDLTSLVGLENITSFNTDVEIIGNSDLTNLAGLENITSIGGDLSILENDALSSLVDLESLVFVGEDLSLEDNENLASCCTAFCWESIVEGNVVINNNEVGCNSLEEIVASCDEACVIGGCMEETACNYDPAATQTGEDCLFEMSWYEDNDGDGLGNENALAIVSCDALEGYVSNASDINDSCFSNEYDCNNECDGTAILNDCEQCVEENEIEEESCFCEDFMVSGTVICTGDTYEVLLAFMGGDAGENGYNIIGNDVTFSNITTATIMLGPYPVNTGFSFNISVVDHPDCVEILNTAVVSCTTTAIELLSFEGKTKTEGNHLTWATASESESAFFSIEKSEDGINFVSIADVESKGNSSISQMYDYVDREHINHIQYYRLKETDKNGVAKIVSDVITLVREDIRFELLSANPVPASESVTLNYTTNGVNPTMIYIYDMMGRLVAQKHVDSKIGFNTLRIDLEDYVAGTYLVQLIDKEQKDFIRFVKTQ